MTTMKKTERRYADERRFGIRDFDSLFATISHGSTSGDGFVSVGMFSMFGL